MNMEKIAYHNSNLTYEIKKAVSQIHIHENIGSSIKDSLFRDDVFFKNDLRDMFKDQLRETVWSVGAFNP